MTRPRTAPTNHQPFGTSTTPLTRRSRSPSPFALYISPLPLTHLHAPSFSITQAAGRSCYSPFPWAPVAASFRPTPHCPNIAMLRFCHCCFPPLERGSICNPSTNIVSPEFDLRSKTRSAGSRRPGQLKGRPFELAVNNPERNIMSRAHCKRRRIANQRNSTPIKGLWWALMRKLATVARLLNCGHSLPGK